MAVVILYAWSMSFKDSQLAKVKKVGSWHVPAHEFIE